MSVDNGNKAVDLCVYRTNNANETLDTAKLCMEHKRYKDAINRCYYAAFYAVKAVLRWKRLILSVIRMQSHILIRIMLRRMFLVERLENVWEG